MSNFIATTATASISTPSQQKPMTGSEKRRMLRKKQDKIWKESVETKETGTRNNLASSSQETGAVLQPQAKPSDAYSRSAKKKAKIVDKAQVWSNGMTVDTANEPETEARDVRKVSGSTDATADSRETVATDATAATSGADTDGTSFKSKSAKKREARKKSKQTNAAEAETDAEIAAYLDTLIIEKSTARPFVNIRTYRHGYAKTSQLARQMVFDEVEHSRQEQLVARKIQEEEDQRVIAAKIEALKRFADQHGEQKAQQVFDQATGGSGLSFQDAIKFGSTPPGHIEPNIQPWSEVPSDHGSPRPASSVSFQFPAPNAKGLYDAQVATGGKEKPFNTSSFSLALSSAANTPLGSEAGVGSTRDDETSVPASLDSVINADVDMVDAFELEASIGRRAFTDFLCNLHAVGIPHECVEHIMDNVGFAQQARKLIDQAHQLYAKTDVLQIDPATQVDLSLVNDIETSDISRHETVLAADSETVNEVLAPAEDHKTEDDELASMYEDLNALFQRKMAENRADLAFVKELTDGLRPVPSPLAGNGSAETTPAAGTSQKSQSRLGKEHAVAPVVPQSDPAALYKLAGDEASRAAEAYRKAAELKEAAIQADCVQVQPLDKLIAHAVDQATDAVAEKFQLMLELYQEGAMSMAAVKALVGSMRTS